MLLYLSLLEEEHHSTFEELYFNYRKLMFFVAQKILRDQFLAEDAVHEAFLRITKMIPEIDDFHCHKTRGLFVTIVENIAIDMYRKRKREYTASYEEVSFYLGRDELRMRTEERELLDIILNLPPTYSSVLRLKYIQGYENQEIAMILGIKEDNVRQRLKRARDMLQGILLEGEDPHGQ